MSRRPGFASLRTSLLTVLGLSVAACGGSVAASDLDRADAGDAGDADGGGGGSGGEGGTKSSVCEGAVEIIGRGGVPSGFWRCADGSVHRAESTVGDPSNDAAACTGTEEDRGCESDDDCAERPHGRCVSFTYDDVMGITQACRCEYFCASDADCGSGEACIPGEVVEGRPIAFCATAACRSGADCESGECGLSALFNGCWWQVSLACRGAEELCRSSSDCTAPAGQSCVHSQEDGWHCEGVGCAIGRPLLVDGRARKAPPQKRDDWAASALLPDITGLDPLLREKLASHWLEVAAMEHASIGSFARFSLELLALGAPPDLLADTQRAALDEIEHARIAYALASAYSGKKLGPGPLHASDIPLTSCRKEAIRSLIFEACVGETLGVAEAMTIADNVRDPVLADILRRIAEDEQRHAELAFRTLAWLLEDASPDEIEAAELAFAEAIQDAARDPEVARMAIPEHGLFDSKALGALRRQALAEVVEPCAAALLGRSKMAA